VSLLAVPVDSRRTPRTSSCLQHKGDLQDDLVGYNLVVTNCNFLFLDPCTLNLTKGLRRSGDTLNNGILEALIGCGADLHDARNRHDDTPCQVNLPRLAASTPYQIEYAVLALIDAMPRHLQQMSPEVAYQRHYRNI
jgi:hypothetical protein